jgi:hypothetical protein
MKSDLQELALSIYEICIFSNINIELEWIPRNENIQADFFSKIFDLDDWSVTDHIFQMLNKKWGNFTFDRFLLITKIVKLTISILSFGFLVQMGWVLSHLTGGLIATGLYPQLA